MTTKITTIYGNIITLLEAELPDYQRLPNPYALEANAFQLLKKAYAVVVSGEENSNRYVGCKLSLIRQFNIILAKQITTTDHNVDKRSAIELDLLEDKVKLVRALEVDPDLAGNVIRYSYVGDQGIELFQAENQKARFYGIQSLIEVEYTESV